MNKSTFQHASAIFEKACDLFLEASAKHGANTSIEERMLVHTNFMTFCNLELRQLDVSWEEFLVELEQQNKKPRNFAATTTK